MGFLQSKLPLSRPSGARCIARALLGLTAAALARAAEGVPLAGTQALRGERDFSVEMRAGFGRFFAHQIADSVSLRAGKWTPDFSSRAAYDKSVEPNRARLRRIVGLVDTRIETPSGPELIATVDRSAVVAENEAYTAFAVRWPVLRGVWAEGLLLEPKGRIVARIVALPDADQTPEFLAGLVEHAPVGFAGRLAAAGCQVLVPVLIDRSDEFSGNPLVAMTNQPYREWIWRQAYQMGRHIIGYEVQKVLAGVDWFVKANSAASVPIAVAGYGEGGLIALYSGAVDPRIDGVLVSGYFDSRQGIADEPIYRDIFGLLNEFGDAEIASLITPRTLVVEHSESPAVAGPPPLQAGRRLSGAPGRIATPPLERVRGEVDRMHQMFSGQKGIAPKVTLIAGPGETTVTPGSAAALHALLTGVTADTTGLERRQAKGPSQAPMWTERSQRERQHRQGEQLIEFTQNLMRASATVREKSWAGLPPKSAADWTAATAKLREQMWDNLIGRYPAPSIPPNARTRRISEQPTFTVYEVVLDVAPDVLGWGQLLVPKSLRPGEKRPVVVCQHGLEGLPADVVDADAGSRAFRVYQGFATRLAERGFITYAPHNYYRGGNEFRQLQRLAHPVGKTLFAVTTLQHQQMLRWLSALDFVDAKRIGFYGLSYGGNTAMRVPAVLEQYAVVIASGDFNEWVFKNVTTDHIHSMMFNNVYEVYEFDLGHTFNHAEMAALIAPRPFMVERGHDDGVARDEWVAAEFAKVRRLYAKLGIPERTTIEFFNGPHQIHGVGTYDFLHRHLDWPVPAGAPSHVR